MTNLIGIYDHTTGKQVSRDMTQEEEAIHNAEIAKILNDKAAAKAAKEEAKTALLTALGITEEQAIILGLIEPPFVARETGDA